MKPHVWRIKEHWRTAVVYVLASVLIIVCIAPVLLLNQPEQVTLSDSKLTDESLIYGVWVLEDGTKYVFYPDGSGVLYLGITEVDYTYKIKVGKIDFHFEEMFGYKVSSYYIDDDKLYMVDKEDEDDAEAWRVFSRE